jgi:ribose/xylose/arabinose/galactoside ABC-type transport system permease subunit
MTVNDARAKSPAQSSFDLFGVLARLAPVIFLILLMAGFALAEPRFLSTINLLNVLRQVSISGLLAIGMTFVILTAGIDLSVGSLLAFCGIAAAIVAKGSAAGNFSLGADGAAAGFGWGTACLVAVAIGLAGGGIQGLAITRAKVPPFVVTLGGMSVFRGAALLLSGGGPISGFDEGFRFWGQGRIAGIPTPVLIFLGFAILAHIVLRYTRFGRTVYAVGGNPEAARLSGLKVNRLLLSVYLIMGFFAGLGGFVLASRLNSAEAVAGLGYELTVIASVVIGGTSLFGGVGTIFGTVIGAVLIGVLLNGLVLLNVSSYIQQIIIGLIIVLAVAFDTFAKSRRRRV